MARFLPFVLWFVLALYATIDCVRTPRDRRPGGLAKPLWIAIIVLVPVLGAIAWLMVKAAQDAEDGRLHAPWSSAGRPAGTPVHPSRAHPAGSRTARRPVAPDDDPAFLADLEQRERARRREERRRAQERGDDPEVGR